MSTTTTNYELIKPELTDVADITATNENWDKIDAELKKKYDPNNKPTASDIGARPNTWTPTANEVGARPNTWMPTAADVGAVSKSGDTMNGDLTFPVGKQVRFYEAGKCGFFFQYDGNTVKITNHDGKALATLDYDAFMSDYALPRDGSAPMTGNLGITKDWPGMAFINPNGVTGNIFANPDANNMFVGTSTDGENNGLVTGKNCLQYVSEGTKYNDILHTGNKDQIFTYGTNDLTAGSSSLETGKLYFVYE